MRIRPLLLFAPVVMAGTMLLTAPAAALAANGMTETGTTTYEVIPSKNLIQVTVQISIQNETPNQTTSSGYTYYYWNSTAISVEASAGPVSAISNGGVVTESDGGGNDYYRIVKLSYTNVYYGQTRIVNATYTIPGAPHAASAFRATQAYASLCAIGNGEDTGSVSVIVPDGFNVSISSGGQLSKTSDTDGKQSFSSGTQTNPRNFWTCIDARNPANLTHTSLTAGGQSFDITGWPEDPAWSTAVGEDVSGDVGRLQDLTGLKMPGGTIVLAEAGDGQLGLYGGTYNSATATADIPETARKDVVAHELSHIWFNHAMFVDTWLSEGLAGYSQKAAGEGNYSPCATPGVYPGSGSPNLMSWQALNYNSTTQDQNVSDWQYAASCYFITVLADAMGPQNFKNVLGAATSDEMAYIGATPGETLPGLKLPLTSEQMLDLLDERGMVPAGIADLDRAQKLLATYGVFDSATLTARSSARATYHALAASAGAWKLPLAIRKPMSTWDFPAAQAAMDTARQILDARAAIGKQLPGFSTDGTDIQKRFQSAATQSDLDGLLTLTKLEVDAAGKLNEATKLRNEGRNPLQALGLLSTDLDTTLKQAHTDLQNVNPQVAGTEAQSVIDQVNGASNQGLLRIGAVAGLLAILLLVIVSIAFARKRRRRPAPDATGAPPVEPYEDLSPLQVPTAEAAATPGPEPPAVAANSAPIEADSGPEASDSALEPDRREP